MTEPDFEIPADRLPVGFAETVDRVPTAPATPRPAATIVLLRDAGGPPEVLLLKRNRTVGFVPGAYVFPGGRVDAGDEAAQALERLSGVSVRQAALRLGMEEGDATAAGYYMAALREAFEETGILVGHHGDGTPVRGATEDEAIRAALVDLHAGTRGFGQLLEDLDVTLNGHALEYIAHWITPEVEPRRYDTRFFAAAVGRDTRALPDGSEITEAVWLTAEAALDRNLEGSLPMVFPTVKTLQSFVPFATMGDLFESFGGRSIPTILPRLVRTPTGVGIQVNESDDQG